MLVIPNQTPGLIDRYGLSRADVDWEVWVVAQDGNRWSGAAAINRTLIELGSLWGWIGMAYRVAPIRWIENRGYRWIAAHRPWLSSWLGAPPEWKD